VSDLFSVSFSFIGGILEVTDEFQAQVNPVRPCAGHFGQGKFENITDKSVVAMADQISVGASFADIDNDGDAGLYITAVRSGNQLFENPGKGQFRDITETSATGIKAHSSGVEQFIDSGLVLNQQLQIQEP
jgi:hypothetical protein